jgi:hypothetical protein
MRTDMSLEHSPSRATGHAKAAKTKKSNAKDEDEDDTYLTRAELAKRWRIAPISITRNWRRLGLMPLCVGTRLLFSRVQIADIERKKIEAGKPPTPPSVNGPRGNPRRRKAVSEAETADSSA